MCPARPEFPTPVDSKDAPSEASIQPVFASSVKVVIDSEGRKAPKLRKDK
jgi:hypothetical protein